VYSKYAGTDVQVSGEEHVLLKVGCCMQAGSTPACYAACKLAGHQHVTLHASWPYISMLRSAQQRGAAAQQCDATESALGNALPPCLMYDWAAVLLQQTAGCLVEEGQ
jgi:hypothetical protein